MIFTIFEWFCALTLNTCGSNVDIHYPWGPFIVLMVALLGSFYWLFHLIHKIKSIYVITFFAVICIASGYSDLGIPFRHWGEHPISGVLTAFFGFWFLNPAFTLTKEYDRLNRDKEKHQKTIIERGA